MSPFLQSSQLRYKGRSPPEKWAVTVVDGQLRVLLCPLPGSKEEWAKEASDQPQSSQPMCKDVPFQDG